MNNMKTGEMKEKFSIPYILLTLILTFSFSAKYQKIWHNRGWQEVHLTKLS